MSIMCNIRRNQVSFDISKISVEARQKLQSTQWIQSAPKANSSTGFTCYNFESTFPVQLKHGPLYEMSCFSL